MKQKLSKTLPTIEKWFQFNLEYYLIHPWFSIHVGEVNLSHIILLFLVTTFAMKNNSISPLKSDNYISVTYMKDLSNSLLHEVFWVMGLSPS